MIAGLINSLKKVIAQQTSTIQSARAEIQEIKSEQQALKEQNTRLQDEIQTLRKQIETQAVNPHPRLWSEVAAGNTTPHTNTITPQSRRETNCVRITTVRPEDGNSSDNNDNSSFTRFLPIDTANQHIRTALSKTDLTKDAQVAGVGTTKTGYVIRFRDAQSAETARSNTAWLDELGSETKLVKPRFGIVVHRVPTEDFDLDREKSQESRRSLRRMILRRKDLRSRTSHG